MAIADLKSQRGISDAAWRATIPTGAGNVNRVIFGLLPTALTIADNESLTDITRANCEGIVQNRLKYAQSSDRTLNVTIGQKTPEGIALAKKKQMETVANADVAYFKNYIRIPDTATPTIPAEAVGTYGNALVLDAPMEGSYIDDLFGVSRPLTQVANATFDPATDTESFSIGTNGQIEFSADLRDLNAVLTEGSYSKTEIWRMTTQISSLSLKVRVVQQDLRVMIWTFPNLIPITQDVTIEAPDQQLSFTIAQNETFEVIGDLTACLGT